MPRSARQPRVVGRSAGSTLAAVELDQGDVLCFKLKNGQVRRLELLSTWAGPLFTDGQVTADAVFLTRTAD